MRAQAEGSRNGLLISDETTEGHVMNRVIVMVPWWRRLPGVVALSVALGVAGCDNAELL